MTNKQTIDGVSRETIQRIADHCKFWIDYPYLEAIADVEVELRALLDSPPRCPGCGYTEQDCREQMDHYLCGMPEPEPANKPDAQPQGEVERLRAALSTSAEPKPRGEVDGNSHAPKQQAEPVLIQAVAVTREDDDEGLRLEWLLEGGIAEMAFAGMVLFAMPEANDLCDEDGSAEIYLSPPSAEQPATSHSGDANEMVAKVVLPERESFGIEDWAGSSCQEALYYGITQDVFARCIRTAIDRTLYEVAKLNGIKP